MLDEDKLNVINDGIDTKVDKIFYNVKKLQNTFEELYIYIRDELPNRINSDNKFKSNDIKVLSNILRNEIWGWNEFGDQTVEFGFFIKDIINNLQKYFLDQGVKKELNKTRKTLENSQIQNEENNKKIKILEEENDKLQNKYENESNILRKLKGRIKSIEGRIKSIELYKNSKLNKELKELKESYKTAKKQKGKLKESL